MFIFSFSSGVIGSVPAKAMQEPEKISFGGDHKCNVVFISEDQNIDPSAFIKAIADKDENEDENENEDEDEDEDEDTYTHTKQFDDGSSIRLNLSSNESDLDSADIVCMCVNGNGVAKDQQQNITNQTDKMLKKIPANKPYCLVSVAGHLDPRTKKPLPRIEHNLKGAESLLSEGTFVWKYGKCKDVNEQYLLGNLANILRENLIQQEKWSEKYILGQNAVSAMSNVQTVYFEPINILFIPTYDEINPYKVIESLEESFRNLYGADIKKLDDNTLEVKVVAQNASATKQAEFVFNLHGESSAFNGLNDETRNTDAVVLYASADVWGYPIMSVQSERMREVIPMLARNGVQLPIYLYATGYNRFHGDPLGNSINQLVLLFGDFRQSHNVSDSIILDDRNEDLAALPRRMATALVRLASQAVKRVDVDVVLPLVDDNDNSFEGLEFSSTPGWWSRRSNVEKGLIIGGGSALAVSAISGVISAVKKQFNKPKCDKQKVSKLSKNSLVKA